MMRKIGILVLLVVLALVTIPVLITQLSIEEPRRLRGVRLDETTYREVRFRNAAQGLSLAGLLFVPPGEGPFPAAVIIHGSGTSRRDNGWYLTLTRSLQDNGIVVLLPDKRGSEQSEGDWRTSSFGDLATDTLAAISFLENQKDVPVSQVGVIGLSQGGWIAPIVASESSNVVFLVDVVGAAVSTHAQLLYEENHNLRQMGFLPGISNVVASLSTLYIRKVAQKGFWDAVDDFDPMPFWKKIEIPCLVLFGEEDTNVPSAESATLLRSLQRPNLEIRIYQGSGHALQDPPGQGDGIFRRDALAAITDFVLRSVAESAEGVEAPGPRVSQMDPSGSASSSRAVAAGWGCGGERETCRVCGCVEPATPVGRSRPPGRVAWAPWACWS